MAYEEFAKVYDELIYEDINYDKISKRLISIIKKYNNKSIDYLDLACGTGNVAVKMAKHFKTNYAVYQKICLGKLLKSLKKKE